MKNKKILIVILLVALLTLNFAKNFISNSSIKIGEIDFWNFQNDSEYLVLSKIFKDKYNMENSRYGLSKFINENDEILDINQLQDNDYIQNCESQNYISQLGLQGHIFSFLYNKLHITIGALNLACCLLLAIVLVAICYVIYNKYSKLMGWIFYITFLLSPWVVAFAKNLYWVEFTWFLPALFGLMLSINYSQKRIFVPLIFISILIKCLCGYEYISTIMLTTIAFFIIDFFNTKDKEEKIKIVKTTLIVGIACVLAFITALIIHGTLRGEGNIIEGVKSIYEDDVLRRTILASEAEQFPEVYSESINATTLETIDKYFSWNTNIIVGIEGKYFKLIFVTVIAILLHNILKKEKNCYRDLIMFIVFLCTTLSWFVLGKAHSYIHTHMNYVLWYFGFVQISIYIIIKFICEKIYEVASKEKGDNDLWKQNW